MDYGIMVMYQINDDRSSDVKASRPEFWLRPRPGLGLANLVSKNVLSNAK